MNPMAHSNLLTCNMHLKLHTPPVLDVGVKHCHHSREQAAASVDMKTRTDKHISG